MKLKRQKWGQSLPREIAVTRSLTDHIGSISAITLGHIIIQAIQHHGSSLYPWWSSILTSCGELAAENCCWVWAYMEACPHPRYPAALVSRREDNEWTVVSKHWPPKQVIQMSATSRVKVKATQELDVRLLQLWLPGFMVVLNTLLTQVFLLVSLLACMKSFSSSQLREIQETRTTSYMPKDLPERKLS